jgi:PAS domain S-box-containing protein
MTTQADSKFISVLKHLPQAASVVVIMVGLLVLLGWTFDIEILKSIIPGIVTMKANAAVAFVLAGASLWLQVGKVRLSAWARRLAQACALIVAVIGLLTFSQYLFGWKLEVDELLFRDSAGAVATSHPGRMSPNSALSFLLVGLALLVGQVETRRGNRAAQIFILAAAFISLFTLIGHAYGAETFFGYAYRASALDGVPTYTQMALHAALAFLILCAGLLAAHPERGLVKIITSKTVGGLTARRLLLVSLVIPPLLGWLAIIGLRARLYDTAFETALFVMANVVVLVTLVWLNARSLDRIEAERNRAGEALREGEERYRIVAETASDAIITIDEESLILFINTAAEKIFGYRVEEMMGRQLTMLMPEYLRHVHRAGIKRYVETGQRHISWEAVELPGLHKSGKEISLELSFGELIRNGKLLFTGVVRDITERKRVERRLATQYTVTRILAESSTLNEAMPKILRAVGESLGWETGVLWRVDREVGVLRCVETWHMPMMAVNEFVEASKRQAFLLGVGLPGRVWESGKPAWITDIIVDDNFPRAPFAEKEGLRGGFAFPVMLGQEILGVMEFFSSEVREPDESLLEMMATIGSQIGQFIERVRSETELQASEHRYRYLADSMPQILWTARPDGYLDYCNRRWVEYTGMTLEQTEGWGWQPAIHPDDVERCLRRWARAVQMGEAYEIEYRFRRAEDGAFRWHLGRAVPMRNERGEIVKWFGSATDIDDRKRAEDSLRLIAEASAMLASSLDYETTLRNVAQLAVPRLADWCVVHIASEDGKIQQLAAAHRDASKLEMLRELNKRYPSGLETAHGYRRVVQTGQPELIPEIVDSLLAEVSHDEEHLRLLRGLGLKSTLCVPLTARGRTLGAITFATAESGRIYNSSDLALAEDLAHRAANAVDSARLYQEAQAANRTKDEFLAVLSHELRTPLTPIIGWVHMIRAGMLRAEELERGLAVVEKNSQALTRLINDLLDMSAIMSGKMRIEKLPVPLDGAIKEAVETVRPLAELRDIKLEAHFYEDQTVIVHGDRTRLVQTFWNILANAIKFSDDHQRVRLTCEASEREARVIIEDEGLGITPEFMPQIFERFRQADSSKTRIHGGLGIGLALVKSFVEAHGGSVTAESKGLGSGSRFVVRLPRLVPPVETKTSDAKATEAQTALNGKRVLVVEDATDTLEMLHKALKARGYHVTKCESGAEALSAAQSSTFDIIISDLGMPEMDGYELIRRLRALAHLSDVPAIALSGYATKRDIEQALDAGFDAHIAKPVDPTDLTRQMSELLEKADDKG